MNITKTEVTNAINRCEQFAGFSTIDSWPVSRNEITRGDLRVLIEAAKCAKYKNIGHTYTPASDSDRALDADEARKPVHHHDQGDDD